MDVNIGWNCTLLPNGTHNCTEIIGDGLVVGDEKCDDGPIDSI